MNEDHSELDKLLNLVKLYAEERLESFRLHIPVQEFEYEMPPQMLNWNNPENIESGLGGITILVLQAYKVSRNHEVLCICKRLITELIEYSHSHQTKNYSLYTGRGGVSYILIEAFVHLTPEVSLLDTAIGLIKDCSNVFLDSKYVNDSLYDGRSGLLLVLVKLFQLTGNQEICVLIERFANKILANGNFHNGIWTWNVANVLTEDSHYGFAKGAEGIKYVLSTLKDFVTDDVNGVIFNQIIHSKFEYRSAQSFNSEIYEETEIKLANNYQQVDDELSGASISNNLHMLNWESGMVGHLFPHLSNFDDSNNKSSFDYHIQELLNIEGVVDLSLAKGIAGIGCFLIFLSNASANDNYRLIARDLATKYIDLDRICANFEEGLMYGDAGTLYFLLKFSEGRSNDESILYPSKILYPNNGTIISNKVPISLTSIRRNIVGKYYARTLRLMEHLCGNFFDKYFIGRVDKPLNDEIECFEAVVLMFLKKTEDPQSSSCVEDLYNHEKHRYQFCVASIQTIHKPKWYLSNLHNRLLDSYCKETFLSTSIQRSSSVLVITSYWNWLETDQNFNKNDLLRNLTMKPDVFETMFFYNSIEGVIETHQNLPGIISWHFFKTSHKINEIIEEFQILVESISDQRLTELTNISGPTLREESWETLRYNLILKIKELLYFGVFDITDQ